MSAQKGQVVHLPVHEWIAVLSILLLMSGLVAVVVMERDRSIAVSVPHYAVDQEMDIVIKGAVEKPGVYRVSRGTLLKELLERAVPTPDANLQKLNLERVLRKGQIVKIPHSQPKKNPKSRKKTTTPNV